MEKLITTTFIDINLSEPLLSKIFPFYILFDAGLRLQRLGSGWTKLGVSLREQDNTFEQYFKVVRPRLPLKFETLRQQPNMLYVIELLATGFQFKAQFTYLPEHELLLMTGVPMVKDAHSLKEMGLALNDFPAYDYISDLMFLMQIHHKMVEEVKDLNTKLTSQNDELVLAQQEMLQLTEELRQQTEEIMAQRDDLEERHELMLMQNEELKQQKEEIEAQRDAIDLQSRQLEYAYKLQSSVSYAKHIQHAMLPQMDVIHAALPEAFVLWRPKDIVSGDFYWFSVKDGKIIIAAVDCTGHGVPGAFMSLIGNSVLNEIVNLRGITEASVVLEELDKGVRNALQQEQTSNNDGMDIALCVIDPERKVLNFAGANNPLVYVQEGELYEVKGSRCPIGGRQEKRQKLFSQTTVPLHAPGSYYIFSDGYADQFGGEYNRRFMSKQLKQLLHDIHEKPVAKQREILDMTLVEWMGAHNQLDDILIIGFKLQ